MSNFEFVFSLLVILLGLALAEVLGGFARAVKRRVVIGWGTGLLAIWTVTETVIFWRIVWRARDVLPDTTPALFGGFLIAACYYFAAALVFPDEFEPRSSLDDYFMDEKDKVIGAILGALALAFGLRPAVMGWASWTTLAWYDWASLAIIYVAGAAAIVSRRRRVAVGCLALLVAIDLLDPFAEMLWPS